MRISDWSSDVCSSDLAGAAGRRGRAFATLFPPPVQGSDRGLARRLCPAAAHRSEEHTSELQSLMRISYAVFCLKTKTERTHINRQNKVIHQTPHEQN